LVLLFSDADVGVRADVAVAMASRMDCVSAPALLALVTQEEMLEPWRQSNVVQAINTLTVQADTGHAVTRTPSQSRHRLRAVDQRASAGGAHDSVVSVLIVRRSVSSGGRSFNVYLPAP
jgi:hypothetical protein